MNKILLLSLIFAIPMLTNAGVVDDWLNDLESTTGAGAYNSGTRGYLTAGSINARANSTNEYLMSINPPRLKAGSCGIDLFLGGMSFMDIDYLGDKLEAVWQNADSVALSMAMSALSKTLDEKGMDFTQAVDYLNNLQFNECELATKGITYAIEGGQWAYDKLFSEEAKTQSVEESVSRNAHETQSDADANSGQPKPEVDIGANLKACEAPIRNILEGNGSIIQRISAAHGISNQEHLMRGYLGDVYISHVGPGEAPVMAILPPCKRNNDNSIDDFVLGLAEQRARPTSLSVNTTGTCTTGSAAGGIFQNSVNRLNELVTNLKNPSANIDPNSDLSKYLNSTPIPVYKIIKWANDIGIEEGIIQELSRVVAYSTAYTMINDLQRTTYAAFLRMNAALSSPTINPSIKATADATSTADTGCDLKPYAPVIEQLGKLENRLKISSSGLHSRYLAKLNELDTFISLNRNYEKMRHKTKQNLTSDK